MTPRRAPRIALAVGDPFGVGPEVALAALAALPEERAGRIDLFAPRDLLLRVAEASGLAPWRDAARRAAFPFALPVPGPCAIPGPTVEGGAVSLACLAAATEAVRRGDDAALATGPISKEAWRLAGCTLPGQTEFLAEACGVPPERVDMLFVGDAFHVVLATRHLPLCKVARALTADRLVDATREGIGALRRIGIRVRRVSLLALNPHASDGGVIGREEGERYAPALARLRAEFPGEGEGATAFDGPHPADGFFARPPADGRLVVAPYHDLGLVPFKMVHPRRGINFTTGLPFLRFSVDHGTAFDIAGRGVADPAAMIHVLERLFAAVERGT